jgi:hypothetical protein
MGLPQSPSCRHRLVRWRPAMITFTAALALALPGMAAAADYWFFQGTLPTSSGVRTAGPQAIVCCTQLNELRMSWTTGTHYMRFVYVRRSDYGWNGQLAYDYDNTIWIDTAYYTAGGCQNPAGLSAVWTNCHIAHT